MTAPALRQEEPVREDVGAGASTSGDPHGLALEYLGLADAIANRHRYPGHDPEDLRQVARLGLLMAIQRYREGAGTGFVPYAVPTITGVIKRHVRDSSWTVRPPRRLQELRLTVRAVRQQLSQELGREPSAEEVARAAGVSEQDVAQAQLADAALFRVSLDPPDPEDRPDPHAQALAVVDPGFEEVESRQVLAAALRGTSEQDRRLLHLRFVEDLSQREIAAILGVSQMQVSRLLRQLLERLRRKAAA